MKEKVSQDKMTQDLKSAGRKPHSTLKKTPPSVNQLVSLHTEKTQASTIITKKITKMMSALVTEVGGKISTGKRIERRTRGVKLVHMEIYMEKSVLREKK